MRVVFKMWFIFIDVFISSSVVTLNITPAIFLVPYVVKDTRARGFEKQHDLQIGSIYRKQAIHTKSL